MIKEAAEAQAEFMRGCGQDVQLGNPNGPLTALYLDLVEEEFLETKAAWNQAVLAAELTDSGLDIEELIVRTATVLDGLFDLMFVTLGAMNSLGVDSAETWEEGLMSNRSKLGPNPKFRDDGKLLKDENFVEPDFVRVVKQSWGMQ